MISIKLNQQRAEVDERDTLFDILSQAALLLPCSVVALNANIIHKDDYAKAYLKADDSVEIFVPMQGG